MSKLPSVLTREPLGDDPVQTIASDKKKTQKLLSIVFFVEFQCQQSLKKKKV